MHILKLDDFTPAEVLNFLRLAQEFADGKQINYQDQKVIANLFFEPSTRTHYSFDMAALRLHCSTINFTPESSSLLKGESLYDTVRTFEAFGSDAIVIRHPDKEFFAELREQIHTPIINGGDGVGNHPTQALLDLLTIQQEFGAFAGLKCLIVGDIKHSRVAHSHLDIMHRLGMEVYTSGPVKLKEVAAPSGDFDEMLPQADIVMMLRVQHERHNLGHHIEAAEYLRQHGLDAERVAKMKPTAIIMHPAPFNRGVEIANEVVECPQSRIFRQVTNGVFVRMALLHTVLGDPDLM